MSDAHVVAIMAAILRTREEGGFYDADAFVEDALVLLRTAKKAVDRWSADSRITPEWCMKTYMEVNPSVIVTPPSLYLVDFARAVVRFMEGSE